MARPSFLNFKVDHMTLLVQPELYNVSYLIFRTIFGCTPEHVLYEKRKEWVPGQGDQSDLLGGWPPLADVGPQQRHLDG